MKKLLPIFIILVCVTGCKNFFGGNDFITDLEKQIEYQNLESTTVRITTRNQNHGTVFPNGDVDFKKGYSVTLELTLSEDYTFENWRVIDKDTKLDVDNVFEFKQFESNGRTIITEATLLQNTPNLQLVPVCRQIKDTIAPKINDGYKFSTSESQLGTQNELLTKKYSDWTAEELKQVHTNSLWLDFSFFELDYENITKYTLEITETLLKDAQGNTSNSQTQFYISDIFKSVDNDGTFCTKYEYPFTSGADGLVKLEIAITDSSKNKSEPISCYVIKDTSINSKIKLLSYAQTQKTYENILKDSNNFYFEVSDLYDNWYSGCSTTVADMQLFILLDSNEENLKEYKVNHTLNTDNYTFEIPGDFDSTQNNSFKIVIRDECNNELTCTAPKFAAPENNFLYLYDSANKKLQIINNTEDEELILYYSDSNPAENKNAILSYKEMKTGICVLDNIDLDSKTFYLFSQKIINGGKIGTDSHISSIATITKSITKTFDSTSTTLDFDYKYVSSGNDGTYLFTVNPKNINGYTSLYVMAGFSNSTSSNDIVYNQIALPCDGSTVMFNLETKYLAPKYDNTSSSTDDLNLILIVGGVKDNFCYEQKKIINTNTLTIADNIPPVVYLEGQNNKSETFDRNIISVRKPYDRSGLNQKDNKEYFKITYFVDGQMDKTLHTITKKIGQNNTNSFINIELSDLINADYSLKPVATDKNNNDSLYGIYKHNISPGYLNTKPTFALDGENVKVSIDMTGYSNFTNYAFNVEYFNPNSNYWYVLTNTNEISKSGNIVSQTFNSGKDKFIRIRFYAYYYNSTNQIDENKVLIYSEPVYFNAGSDNQTTLKNVSKGFGGFTIDCDKPCLVQTYYSKTDFGNSPSAWEKNCSENKKINPKLYTSHNVYEPDLDEINDGYFYTVIATFCDGKSIMTDVYKN